MVPVTSLWLPILVSAVFVFVASSIIHMLLGYHRSDWQTLPSQDDVRDALRRFSIPPGYYMHPYSTSTAEMRSPEFAARVEKGPRFILTIFPGATYLRVFQFAGTVAFCGYSLALLQPSIWYNWKWSTTPVSMFDGPVYALLTAGTFGWLWRK